MYGPNVNQKILNCFTTGLKKPKWGAEQKNSQKQTWNEKAFKETKNK